MIASPENMIASPEHMIASPENMIASPENMIASPDHPCQSHRSCRFYEYYIPLDCRTLQTPPNSLHIPTWLRNTNSHSPPPV
jgi:hypothetical protein